MNDCMLDSQGVFHQIRVPAKVIRAWSEPEFVVQRNVDGTGGVYPTQPHLFCMLEDGRVYQSMRVGEERVWVLHTPAVPDR